MSQRKIITITSIFIMLFAGSLFAQERIAIPTVPCPHPIVQTLTAPPPSPPTPSATDFSGTLGTAVAGSTWNQTNYDHGFGHSFKLPPLSGKCCVWTKGTLIVKVKALVAGGAGSATSVNDWVQLVQNGAYVQGTGQQPFSGGATVGQTATVTIAVPQSVLSSGIVSLYVQDDTAVLGAELRLEGCCI